MSFQLIKDIIETASYCATIIGIPVAIAVFVYEKRKERHAQEVDTYLRSNEKYIQYIALCLQFPDLAVYDKSTEEKVVIESGLSVKQLAMYTVLISTLETGFYLYRHHGSKFRKEQWTGWHAYMIYWARRKDFHSAWATLGPQFDQGFQDYLNGLINEADDVIGP